jgi:hypothetical protein
VGNVVALCGRQAAGSVECTIDHVNSRMISLRPRRVQYFRLLRFADCRKYVTGRRATYQFVLESVISLSVRTGTAYAVAPVNVYLAHDVVGVCTTSPNLP